MVVLCGRFVFLLRCVLCPCVRVACLRMCAYACAHVYVLMALYCGCHIHCVRVCWVLLCMWTSGRAKNVLLANIDAEGNDMLPITKLADFGTVRADVRHRKLSGQATSEQNMESHGVTKQIIGTRQYELRY